MIDYETQLKLQACVDGELPRAEAREISQLLDRDAEARALYDELKATKDLLVGNEVDLKLPESREFYWSKIRSAIERAEQAGPAELRETAPASWWVRFLAPASVVAALVVFVTVSLMSPWNSTSLLALGEGHEIETPLEETSSFTFRSETAAMTVVWVDSHRN